MEYIPFRECINIAYIYISKVELGCVGNVSDSELLSSFPDDSQKSMKRIGGNFFIGFSTPRECLPFDVSGNCPMLAPSSSSAFPIREHSFHWHVAVLK